jgi:hypothetical protein
VNTNKYNPQPTTHNTNNQKKNQHQQQKFEYRSCKEPKGKKFVQETKGGKEKHTRKSLLACLLAAYTQVATNFMICAQCQ